MPADGSDSELRDLFEGLSEDFIDNLLYLRKIELEAKKYLASLTPIEREAAYASRTVMEGDAEIWRCAVEVGAAVRRIIEQQIQQQRARMKREARRNPKLDAHVQSKKNQTASEILVQLELMTGHKRRKAIGQTKLPGLTTIKDAKKRTS